jgi:diguanylate cyclase (GGDEF)-like protein
MPSQTQHDSRRRGSRDRRIHVLLASQDPTLRRRWKDQLSGETGLVVQLAPLDFTTPWPDGRVDVLVTDGSLPLVPCDRAAGTAGPPRPQMQIVAVGANADGHIRLADDPTPRELVLACELGGRIRELLRRDEKRRRAMRRLRRWAMTDPLTGMANRRAWMAELSARSRSQPPSAPSRGLLLLDIDHFKRINDRFGHATGDDILCRMAEVLTARMHPPEYAARLGGDEFGVLLGDADPATAWDRAEWLRRELTREAGGPVEGFSVSGGLVVVSASGWLDDAHYRAASDALRQAKHTGRSRLCQTPSP